MKIKTSEKWINKYAISQHTPTPWISEPINYDAYSAAIRLPDPLTGKSNGMGTLAHLMGTNAEAEGK